MQVVTINSEFSLPHLISTYSLGRHCLENLIGWSSNCVLNLENIELLFINIEFIVLQNLLISYGFIQGSLFLVDI